jgi:hypothetical protein
MSMMNMNKYLTFRTAAALALFALSSQYACSQQTPSATRPGPAGFSNAPFPPAAARYAARLFEVTEPDEAHYDAEFARKLRELLARSPNKDKKLYARMTSGPATTGNYISGDRSGYVHYATCQAHQCDTTTLDVLYDPASKNMVAKVLDRCAPQWLGNPNETEMALLDREQRASHPASVSSCAGAK